MQFSRFSNLLTSARSFRYRAGSSRNRMILTLLTGVFIGICVAQLISYVTRSSDIYLESEQIPFGARFHNRPYDNSSVADQLKREVRILCWVMTNPTNHKKRARHVKLTWGKRCNILLFMSSAEDDKLPTIKLDVEEGRANLWRKVKEAFKYVYKHHYNDADWFFKADDDTYAVIENLRYMLYPYNPETPVHFGFKFKPYVKQGYMSGGAGYVLSREAVRRLVVEGIPNPKMCLNGTVENEDIEIGRCMENLNVTAGDSRDYNGRGRMFPLYPVTHLIPANSPAWYWESMFYKTDDGLDCCSNNSISFHYVAPGMMYLMDFLIYCLNPFGIVREPHLLPAKRKVGEFLPPPIEEPANSNEDSIDDEDRLNKTTTRKSEPDSKDVKLWEVDLNKTETVETLLKVNSNNDSKVGPSNNKS